METYTELESATSKEKHERRFTHPNLYDDDAHQEHLHHDPRHERAKRRLQDDQWRRHCWCCCGRHRVVGERKGGVRRERVGR